MEHSFINTNQCRNFGAEVQDNQYNQKNPIKITSPDTEFVTWLQLEGTVLFLDTWYTTQGYSEVYPHIEMTKNKYGVQEEIEWRNVVAASMGFSCEVSRETEQEYYEKYSHAD